MIGVRTSKSDFSYEVKEVAGIAPYINFSNRLLLTFPYSQRNAPCLQLDHNQVMGGSEQPGLGHLITSYIFDEVRAI
jgi:hypothetical protein